MKPWKDKNPPSTGKKLSPEQKARARARAKKAGRPYPNWVDNAWAAKTAAFEAGVVGGLEKVALSVRDVAVPVGMAMAPITAATALYYGIKGVQHARGKPDDDERQLQRRVGRERRDPRLYSNLRGALAFETAAERRAAHRLLSPGARDTKMEAFREGFFRRKRGQP